MKFRLFILSISLLFINTNLVAQKTINIKENFDKIIVSPHIEAVFKKGNKTSIEIENITVPEEKFQYEIENGTLQVYLKGAKTYTKNKKIIIKNQKRKVPLYKNRVVTLTITYKDVDTFSLRGEQKITFKSPLNQESCKLRIYGESEVKINFIDVEKLYVSIYGNSFLNIEKGKIQKQKITAYGASKIMASDISTEETKITAFGDGTFKLNASKIIKVTSYGEATILYKGDAKLKKGLVIGDSTIEKLQ